MSHGILGRALPALSLALTVTGGCAGDLENRAEFELLLGSGGGTDSSGTGGSDDPAATDYDVPGLIFAEHCASSSCHAAESSNPLDLESADFATRLNRVGTQSECGNIVDFEEPSNSLLYRAVTAATGSDCGGVMPPPYTQDTLSAEQQEAILQWIINGAQDNPGEQSSGTGGDGSGEGGTGGEVVAVGDDLDRTNWTITANPIDDDAANRPSLAIDGDTGTRYTTGAPMTGAEWIRIDFGQEETFSQVELDYAGSTADFPPGYAIYVTNEDSTAAADWGTELASGAGTSSGSLIVNVGSQTGRYLVIAQTGTSDNWWSVYEIYAR